jgi:hypothetical protein
MEKIGRILVKIMIYIRITLVIHIFCPMKKIFVLVEIYL